MSEPNGGYMIRPGLTNFLALCGFLYMAVAVVAVAVSASQATIVLPNGWKITSPIGLMTETDTMPEGAAASPDQRTIAVVDSGFNPATLRIYSTATLEQLAQVSLQGGFGRPVWLSDDQIAIAGANADGILIVSLPSQTVRTIALGHRSFPVAITKHGSTLAVATDGDSSVRIGSLDGLSTAQPIHVGGHISSLAFSDDGQTLYVSCTSYNQVAAIDVRRASVRRFPTGLHPAGVLPVGDRVYVAESDADTIGVYSLSGHRLSSIYVGTLPQRTGLVGASPNALSRKGTLVFASLGAANSIAVIAGRSLVGRIAAGWYPTDAVPIGNRLFVIDAKGEGTVANPYFKAQSKGYLDYIGALQYGSIRVYNVSRGIRSGGSPQGAIGPNASVRDSVVRSGGPIKHVFFILKENRSYDEVLGDMPEGNGDAKITWFDAKVTPNQHALARRYGLFDNTYASGEVSESGHFWADAAFVTDYVERTWPMTYAGRDTVDDAVQAVGTGVPRNGYIWQRARESHVSFRDYGEMINMPSPGRGTRSASARVSGMSDPRYVSWNLNYSDINRFKEWRNEFRAFLKSNDVPQLEWIWLPNDHTAGSRIGKLTPVAYVAQNDYAVGEFVDEISHSKIWSSSVVFITEDDAQDGPDHVSDQRTTFFLVSPYARAGVHHEHYSTVGIVRTVELLLGLKPLSTYDALAAPVLSGFTPSPNLRPFDAIAPKVSITSRNVASTFGARLSAKLDFSRPDAVAPALLSWLLANNHEH